jgi:hypothetical protein
MRAGRIERAACAQRQLRSWRCGRSVHRSDRQLHGFDVAFVHIRAHLRHRGFFAGLQREPHRQFVHQDARHVQRLDLDRPLSVVVSGEIVTRPTSLPRGPSMKRSTAAIRAFFSRLRVTRAPSVVLEATSRSTSNATTLLLRLPHAGEATAAADKRAAGANEGSRKPVRPAADSAPSKVVVSLKFDAALLAKVDAATKRQGITRTAWLHRAAFDALGE